MIAVKPIDMTDTILTSTVPEPDISKGEVEWMPDRFAGFDASTQVGLDQCVDIHFANSAFYVLVFPVTPFADSYLYKYDSNGAYLSESINIGVGRTSFTVNGNIFALDGVLAGGVTEYDETGAVINSYSISANVDNPNGICFNGSHYYIFDRATSKIYRYTELFVYDNFSFEVSEGSGKGYGLNYVDGYIYFANQGSGFIIKYSVDGSEIARFDISDQIDPTFIGGTASDDDGMFYICNQLAGSGLIKRFTNKFVYDGLYKEGDRAILAAKHLNYQSVSNNNDSPDAGVLLPVPTWVKVGPTNKYAMFDFTISSETDSLSPLVVDITAGTYATAVAGFNINGAETINVTVVSAFAGEVYNRDIEMNDNSAIIDAWTYYFEPIVKRDRFVLLDLPPYIDATVTVTFTGSDITIGALVVGPQVKIGVANYNTEIQLLDFSTQARNQFGDFEIVKRSTADLVKFDVSIQKNNVSYVKRQFQELSQVPAVWVGESGNDDDPTAVFGYYEKFVNNISSPSITKSTITIQGLV